MTTINTVPEPLSFREKASAIWSILRNQRWANRQQGTKTLHTYTPYIAEAYYKGGEHFIFQWYGDVENVRPGWFVHRCLKQLPEDQIGEAVLTIGVEELVNARLIRRRDLAVTQIVGKELPDAFTR